MGARRRTTAPKENTFAAAPAFATFERDLLDDVIPAIDSRYGTYANGKTVRWPDSQWGRTIAEFRAGTLGYLCLGRRLLVGPKH